MDPCDPSANVGDTDQDNDGFENRQDLCPNSAAAGNNDEAEVGTGAPANDDGPVSDSMGNPCDAGVVAATINNRVVNFTLSTTVGNGRYHASTNNDPICFGGTDADGDGYCSTNEGGQDANPVRHSAWSGAYAAPLLQQDTDGDTFSDARDLLRYRAHEGLPAEPRVPGCQWWREQRGAVRQLADGLQRRPGGEHRRRWSIRVQAGPRGQRSSIIHAVRPQP